MSVFATRVPGVTCAVLKTWKWFWNCELLQLPSLSVRVLKPNSWTYYFVKIAEQDWPIINCLSCKWIEKIVRKNISNQLYGTCNTFSLKYFTVFCTVACKIFIEPPPDTQRTERQGERGTWVDMGCYLLQATPSLLVTSPTFPPPPHRASVAPACGYVIRIRGPKGPPPSPSHLGQFFCSLARSRGWPLFWRLWVW